MARIVDYRLFYKKTFYLDLRNSRYEAELAKDIKIFGGKIESFLSKDINYVISDRPEAKAKIEPCSPETQSSTVSMLSPVEVHKSPSVGFMYSPAPSSPFNDLSKGTILSRGMTFIQKAKQKSEGTGDVLGICNQWKIKVVHVKVVLFWINKCKDLYAKRLLERKKAKESAAELGTPKRKLVAPFMKVEDVSRRYKCAYKEFKPKDAVFTSTLSRAVSKVQEDLLHGNVSQENPVPSVLKEVNGPCHDRHSPITVSFTPVIHKNFSSSSVFKKQFGSKMGLISDSKENTPKFPQFKVKKDHKGSSNSQRLETKHMKYKYCEICQVNFQDLDAHVLTKMHRSYMNNSLNYQAVKEVISTMPSWENFLKKVARERKERMLQQPVYE